MDNDRISGKLDRALGKVKQKVGDALGNDHLANEGVADQVKGSAKETWGNVKDAARTTGSNAHDDDAANRETFSEKLTDAHESVNEKIDEFKDRERRRSA